MHLLIDIGNSRIKWVCIESKYTADIKSQAGTLVELINFINTIDVSKTIVMIAAVNQTDDLKALIQAREFKKVTWAISQKEQAGIRNSYDLPERMGIDRWLAMVAGFKLRENFQNSAGIIVVDAGSAMTVDVVDSSGLHRGGYIVPGLQMAQRALFANTEQVVRYNEVSLSTGQAHNEFNLGNNTLQCVEYGVMNQLVALIVYVAAKFPSYNIIFSGGDGDMLASYFDSPIVDQNLVLKGLWQVRR
jgi:type III pantothenate kinase